MRVIICRSSEGVDTTSSTSGVSPSAACDDEAVAILFRLGIRTLSKCCPLRWPSQGHHDRSNGIMMRLISCWSGRVHGDVPGQRMDAQLKVLTILSTKKEVSL